MERQATGNTNSQRRESHEYHAPAARSLATGKRFPRGQKGHLVGSPTHHGLEQKRPKAPPVHGIAIEEMEPRVTLNVAGRTVDFLLDSGGAYSMLNSCSGALSLSLKSCQILRVER